MLPARTYSVSIRRNWRALYEEIWRPEIFPQWASGLSSSELGRDGEGAEVTLRLDPDVIEKFRESGPGWQGRMNAALRKAVGI
jgi:uncharacterized protein (DUF4415 family)